MAFKLEPACRVWPLERYARLTLIGPQTDDTNKWEYFNNSKEKLDLTLTKEQMFIHNGRTLLESVPLGNADKLMRGISKGDSILIIYKLQNESRRFRMKFSPLEKCSAESQCHSCVKELSKYFPMKLTTSGAGSQQVGSTPERTGTARTILEGEVTLGKMAEAVLREGNMQLPSVYQSCSSIDPHSLSTMVKLCLTDPNFPDFVDQVEQELEKIKRDCV